MTSLIASRQAALTIAYITFRGMLGRKRALLLFVLPTILIVLAVVLRVADYHELDTSTTVLHTIAVGTLLPLLSLIAGTGVIGPEIDDGQIMYIVTKPIPRHVITTTKLAVAIVLMLAFGVIPVFLAGLILVGTTAQLSLAFALGVLVGGLAYCAIFVALATASRFAVVIGLLYALVWESLLGNFATGAKSLSVQQWAMAVTQHFTSATSVTSSVSLLAATIMLIVVIAGGTALAAFRLQSLSIASAD
jgi:ABC-2 type transport system permease protein